MLNRLAERGLLEREREGRDVRLPAEADRGRVPVGQHPAHAARAPPAAPARRRWRTSSAACGPRSSPSSRSSPARLATPASRAPRSARRRRGRRRRAIARRTCCGSSGAPAGFAAAVWLSALLAARARLARASVVAVEVYRARHRAGSSRSATGACRAGGDGAERPRRDRRRARAARARSSPARWSPSSSGCGARRGGSQALLRRARCDRAGPGRAASSSPTARCSWPSPGCGRPRIVISAGALVALDDAELLASLDHERGHIALRHRYLLVAGELARAVARFLPGTRAAARELVFSLERDADRYALDAAATTRPCWRARSARPRRAPPRPGAGARRRRRRAARPAAARRRRARRAPRADRARPGDGRARGRQRDRAPVRRARRLPRVTPRPHPLHGPGALSAVGVAGSATRVTFGAATVIPLPGVPASVPFTRDPRRRARARRVDRWGDLDAERGAVGRAAVDGEARELELALRRLSETKPTKSTAVPVVILFISAYSAESPAQAISYRRISPSIGASIGAGGVLRAACS